jgi:hypothetical protein
MGIRLSTSKTITATGETDLLSDPYIAFLKRLSVSNSAAAAATVQVKYYNGTASKVVLTLKVPSGSTTVLEESELPGEACPTKISISTDQQPIVVDASVELE